MYKTKEREKEDEEISSRLDKGCYGIGDER